MPNADSFVLLGANSDLSALMGKTPVFLTTFRKQRNNERTQIARARKAAEECALRYP